MVDISEEKKRLFKQVYHQLGAPVRQVELPEEQLCTLLELSIENYAMYVQNWLIENQWSSLLGKNASNMDIAFALSVRSIDYESQFSYAYSKQVGLQQRGPWELKKDFVTIQAGQQVYQIPAGRELNEVLYLTPPATDHALMAYYGGFDFGFGGGMAQLGSGYANGGAGGYGHGGSGGYYIAPAFDVLLTAQDFNLKHRLLRSDLTYKVTAGPDDTRLLHLISTPGSSLTFGNGLADGNTPVGGRSSIGLQGCQVWYHYYDTNPGNLDECRRDNPDIIQMPNEVPLERIDFSKLNEPTKVLVRQLLTAEAKKVLGRIRGKFGGVVGPPEAERTMDYESLISEGNVDYKEAMEKLEERLRRMSNAAMLEAKAQEAEHLNTTLKYRPLGFWVK